MTQYQRWQTEVFERDDYTCQNPNCGANTCLDAAHIIARSQATYSRYDINNGITLCRTCHEHFHNHPGEWHQFITALRHCDPLLCAPTEAPYTKSEPTPLLL